MARTTTTKPAVPATWKPAAGVADAGYLVIRLAYDRSAWPEVFKAYADLFGIGAENEG